MAMERAAMPAHSLRVLPGGRARPTEIVQSRADALTPVLEAIAVCDDALRTAVLIHNAELARDVPSLAVLSHAAGLAHRAKASRDEMRSMARHLDGGGDAA